MNITLNHNQKSRLRLKSCLRWTGSALAAFGLLSLMPGAHADDPVTMAPPVSDSQPLSPQTTQAVDGTPTNTSQDSVFNWNEIPTNQQVPLTRVAFDQGGYQLYDTAGETIVVPFANKNLYVMKFAVSPNNTMFFVNTGGAPVLYVPQNGYLENATVPGAKWYPFSEKFHPAEPVFLGIAPSYPVFVDLGWYPHTILYGGYYCSTPFVEGGVFLPTIGLSFVFGGHSFYGYAGYRDYIFLHPAPYHIGYFHRDFYRFAGRPIGPGHTFYGGGHGGFEGRGPVGFHGWDHSANGGFRGEHQAFGGGSHSFGGGGHVFRGASTFGNGSHPYTGSHSFSGSGDHTMYAHRTFQGAGRSYSSGTSGRSYSSGSSGSHSFSGGSAGSHSFGGGSTGSRSGSGGHSFSGGRSSGGHSGGNRSR